MSSEMIKETATSASGVTTEPQPIHPGSNPKKRKRDDDYQELLDRRNQLIWLILHQNGEALIVQRKERLLRQLADLRKEFRECYPDPCQPVPYGDGTIAEMRGIMALIERVEKHIKDMCPQYNTTTVEENEAQLEDLNLKLDSNNK